jgi:hypothetical protein
MGCSTCPFCAAAGVAVKAAKATNAAKARFLIMETSCQNRGMRVTRKKG